MEELSQPEQSCNLEQALSLNVFFCNANYPPLVKTALSVGTCFLINCNKALFIYYKFNLCGALGESKVVPKPALFKDSVCTKPGDIKMEFIVQLCRLDFTGRTVLLFLILNF